MELLIRIDNYEEWACDDSQGFSELDKENVKAQAGFDSVIGMISLTLDLEQISM